MPEIGRPQLGVGTAGQVRLHPEGDGYVAVTLFRDFDCRIYQIQRHRKTKGAAQRALAEVLSPDPPSDFVGASS